MCNWPLADEGCEKLKTGQNGAYVYTDDVLTHIVKLITWMMAVLLVYCTIFRYLSSLLIILVCCFGGDIPVKSSVYFWRFLVTLRYVDLVQYKVIKIYFNVRLRVYLSFNHSCCEKLSTVAISICTVKRKKLQIERSKCCPLWPTSRQRIVFNVAPL